VKRSILLVLVVLLAGCLPADSGPPRRGADADSVRSHHHGTKTPPALDGLSEPEGAMERPLPEVSRQPHCVATVELIGGACVRLDPLTNATLTLAGLDYSTAGGAFWGRVRLTEVGDVAKLADSSDSRRVSVRFREGPVVTGVPREPLSGSCDGRTRTVAWKDIQRVGFAWENVSGEYVRPWGTSAVGGGSNVQEMVFHGVGVMEEVDVVVLRHSYGYRYLDREDGPNTFCVPFSLLAGMEAWYGEILVPFSLVESLTLSHSNAPSELVFRTRDQRETVRGEFRPTADRDEDILRDDMWFVAENRLGTWRIKRNEGWTEARTRPAVTLTFHRDAAGSLPSLARRSRGRCVAWTGDTYRLLAMPTKPLVLRADGEERTLAWSEVKSVRFTEGRWDHYLAHGDGIFDCEVEVELKDDGLLRGTAEDHYGVIHTQREDGIDVWLQSWAVRELHIGQ
jgi:hypothetical protein